jgi:hypothetical protein
LDPSVASPSVEKKQITIEEMKTRFDNLKKTRIEIEEKVNSLNKNCYPPEPHLNSAFLQEIMDTIKIMDELPRSYTTGGWGIHLVIMGNTVFNIGITQNKCAVDYRELNDSDTWSNLIKNGILGDNDFIKFNKIYNI